MTYNLAEIAKKIGGELVGDGTVDVTGSATICNVKTGEITFATDEKHWNKCLVSQATAVIVSGFRPDGQMPFILVPNAETAFAQVTEMFRPAVKRNPVGISPQAHVSPLAKIGRDVSIYPGAYVADNVSIGDRAKVMPNVTIMENCSIGADVIIFPNSVLYENTVVGDRSIIHGGVVLGAFGFGYRTKNGKHLLCSQLGSVEIGCDVEIGANSTIDRGTFDATRVGDGTKIDDQVMIGHNCQIGKHNLLCSQVGIAGSCITGDYVVMGGQVGVGDHIEIASEAVLGAKSGVMSSLSGKQHYWGTPAKPIREEMQILASAHKLPEFRKQVASLLKQIEHLLQENSASRSSLNDPHSHRDAA